MYSKASPLVGISSGDRWGKVLGQKISNLGALFCRDRFFRQHPVVHGVLLELRSALHRIRAVVSQGCILSLEMGPVWEEVSAEYLVPNRRGQSRIQDIKRLLSSRYWLSPEDCRLFLLGWDAGEQYGVCLGTSDSNEQTRLHPSHRL
jgi:hypothetical protein